MPHCTIATCNNTVPLYAQKCGEHQDYSTERSSPMNDTGHKKLPIGGKTLVEWITPTVKDECRLYKVPMPTDKQMAVVISALRAHTIIMHAAEYDKSNLHKPNEVDSYWPMQSSIGRYFRDAARETLDMEGEK